MKKSILINALLAFSLTFSIFAQSQENSSEAPSQEDLLKELGYFYGYSFGNMLKDGGSGDVDVNELVRGLADSLASSMPDLDQVQRQRVIEEIQRRQEEVRNARLIQQQQLEEAQAAQGVQNLEAAQAFLLENASKEGVTTTATGLQYEVITDVSGPTANATSRVSVHYKGTLLDGTVFDQSRETPVEFGLSQVIPGWTEGLQLMSAGDKFRLFLHPDLAYGSGSVGQIPPNSLLIFEVELLEIK